MRTYDLIFGILARQLRLASRESLSQFAAFGENRTTLSLPDYLRENDALSTSDEKLLQRLTDSIIHAHRGDELAALEALGASEAVEDTFAISAPAPPAAKVLSTDKTIVATGPSSGVEREFQPEIIGRYTGGSEYARGGIGRILLVHDEQIGRDVILKELLPEHAVSPTASTISPAEKGDSPSPSTPMRQSAAMMARFLQEAKVTGQLEHPSIVPVYELGTRADGRLYYTMKLVRGETLANAIQRCKNAKERLALLRPFLDVCQAMAYAHSKGVIHRDLKPSNIMVGEFGECVVLDWGLAKTAGDRDAHHEALEKTLRHLDLDPDEVTDKTTHDNDVLGTPLYMSPEQARGELDTVGSHSDIYSLGVVLYELLTGEVPHPWTNSRDTIRRVGSIAAPLVSKAAPHTPPELAAICDKALSFASENRYPTARELADDIRLFLEGAIVGAYAYRFSDKVVRLYREHKALINSAMAAILVVAAMGTLSYVKIYKARQAETEARIIAEQEGKEADQQRKLAVMQRTIAEKERDRATQAESQTADEKYIADIRLADAYIRDGRIQAAEETLLGTDPGQRRIEWGYLTARCNQEIATLEGHTERVFSLRYMPNGTHVLSLSGDRSARLWNTKTGQAQFTWSFPKTLLRSSAVSENGKYIGVGAYDGSIHLLNSENGEKMTLLEPNGNRVNGCNFNADGTRLVTSSSDGIVRIWDTATGKLERALPPWPSGVQWAGFAPVDGQLLVNTSKGDVLLVDQKDAHAIYRGASTGLVRGIAGDLLLVSGKAAVHAIDARTLATRHSLRLDAAISRVRLYDEGTAILVGSRDGLIRLWNGQTGEIIRTVTLGSGVQDCRRSADGSLLFAVDQDSVRSVWDLHTGTLLNRIPGTRSRVTTIAISNDTETFLTATEDGTLRKWLTHGTTHRRILDSDLSPIVAIALSNEGNRVAVRRANGMVRVIDTQNNKVLLTLKRQPGTTGTGLCLNSDGTLLGLVLDEFMSVLVDVNTGNVVTRLNAHPGYVLGMTFSADGKSTITTSWDNKARLWENATGMLLHTFTGHKNTVVSAAFSQDERYLVTVSSDHEAIIWNLDSYAERFRIRHENRVLQAAFSPDSTAVATASADGTVQVWETETGVQRFESAGQMEKALTVDFSPDGARLLTTSSRAAHLWDAKTGLRLLSIDTPLDRPKQAFFSHSEPGILIASQAGNLVFHATLPIDSAVPIISRTQLDGIVQKYQRASLPREQDQAKQDSNTPTIQFCRYADLVNLFAAWSSKGTENLAAVQVTASERLRSSLASLGLEEGDVVKFSESDGAAVYQQLLERKKAATGKDAFLVIPITVTRRGHQQTIRLTSLPAPVTAETVVLEKVQARALLEACIKMLRTDADTIMEVNRDRTWRILHESLAPGTLSGYWILAPTNPLWSAPLAQLHLYPQSRIISVSKQPIHSLSQLARLCESGLEYMDAHDTFDVSLHLTRGIFTDVQVTIRSKP